MMLAGILLSERAVRGAFCCSSLCPRSSTAPPTRACSGLEIGRSTPGRFSASVRQHAVLRVVAKEGIRPSSSAGGRACLPCSSEDHLGGKAEPGVDTSPCLWCFAATTQESVQRMLGLSN